MADRFSRDCYPKDGTQGPYGFHWGQMRGEAFIRNGWWFSFQISQEGERMLFLFGYGDVSAEDLHLVADNLQTGEAWIIIPDSNFRRDGSKEYARLELEGGTLDASFGYKLTRAIVQPKMLWCCGVEAPSSRFTKIIRTQVSNVLR